MLIRLPGCQGCIRAAVLMRELRAVFGLEGLELKRELLRKLAINGAEFSGVCAKKE